MKYPQGGTPPHLYRVATIEQGPGSTFYPPSSYTDTHWARTSHCPAPHSWQASTEPSPCSHCSRPPVYSFSLCPHITLLSFTTDRLTTEPNPCSPCTRPPASRTSLCPHSHCPAQSGRVTTAEPDPCSHLPRPPAIRILTGPTRTLLCSQRAQQAETKA